MSAWDNMNPGQFRVPLHEVGHMKSGDWPHLTMNGVSRLPHSEAGGYRYPKPADERELREAIVEQGGVHTPLKMQLEEGNPTIIDGTHRFRAAKRTGQTLLPVEYLGPANSWGNDDRASSPAHYGTEHAQNPRVR